METALVENMVCPLCARMHGKPHAEACPRVYEGPFPSAYEAGYAGAGHQKHEVAELMQSRLARIFRVYELAEQVGAPLSELREACSAEGLLPPLQRPIIQKRGK